MNMYLFICVWQILIILPQHSETLTYAPNQIFCSYFKLLLYNCYYPDFVSRTLNF